MLKGVKKKLKKNTLVLCETRVHRSISCHGSFLSCVVSTHQVIVPCSCHDFQIFSCYESGSSWVQIKLQTIKTRNVTRIVMLNDKWVWSIFNSCIPFFIINIMTCLIKVPHNQLNCHIILFCLSKCHILYFYLMWYFNWHDIIILEDIQRVKKNGT